MFINFWYPATKSEDLKEEPLQIQILGQDLVVFRDSTGRAHCLHNVCVHRGGSLAHGKRKGDCIECPYHGWQFDGDGKCTRIPSLGPDAKIPPRARVDSYPTAEKFGLVHVFLGDLPEAERPPIMDIPEYSQEGWRPTIQNWVFAIDYKRSIENGIDPGHSEFVHPTHGYSGANDDYKLEIAEPIITEWGSGIVDKREGPPLPDSEMRETGGRSQPAVVESRTGHHCVNAVWTEIHLSPEMWMHQYLYEAPIDAGHTSIYLINMRNFMIDPEHDERVMHRNEVVALQDRDVMEPLRPILTPRTNTKEVFVVGDEPVARYRTWLKEWEELGWRIDTNKLEQDNSKTVYAIPSPARRSKKGWAFDPIPLLPGKPEAPANTQKR